MTTTTRYTSQVPTNTIQVLIDRDRIAARVEELAAQISSDLADVRSEGEIVLVPILTGAIIFVADLIRHLPHKIRIEVASVQSYHGQKVKTKRAQIIGALPKDVQDKHVLIVDDILDSGETIQLIRDHLAQHNPKSLRCCVLLRKQRVSAMNTPCEYIGFDIPDEFVVGYGLDYKSYYRNLPDVCTFNGDML